MCIFVGKSKPEDLVMAKLDKKTKENPKLEQRELTDGRISLYLEYYDGRISEPVTDDFGDPVLYKSGEMAGTPKYKVKHIRHKESLNLYLIAKPRTPIERQQNKDTLALAEKIKHERQQELLEHNKGYRLKKENKIDFLLFFQEYIETYTKKDVRMIQMALQRFKDFLRDTPEYTKYLRGIKPQQIDNEMVEAFTEYLQDRSKGEGAKSIYQRFKKVFKSCAIKYNINYQHSSVTLPLTDALVELMGEQPEARGKDELVFTLPSHTMCLKALRRWTKRAGIDKHITWHCARHSFGTNMAATAAQKGFSVRVVQEMMGHSSLRYTERYTRVVDEQKKAAMAELSKMMEG